MVIDMMKFAAIAAAALLSVGAVNAQTVSVESSSIFSGSDRGLSTGTAFVTEGEIAQVPAYKIMSNRDRAETNTSARDSVSVSKFSKEMISGKNDAVRR